MLDTHRVSLPDSPYTALVLTVIERAATDIREWVQRRSKPGDPHENLEKKRHGTLAMLWLAGMPVPDTRWSFETCCKMLDQDHRQWRDAIMEQFEPNMGHVSLLITKQAIQQVTRHIFEGNLDHAGTRSQFESNVEAVTWLQSFADRQATFN